ncbi:MAG TPA: hypothetical protein VEB18_02505 [Candidatus Paceibacterota bacterium]|nr:hypothetical protein [Candidatus Paceibacterota bacterium]
MAKSLEEQAFDLIKSWVETNPQRLKDLIIVNVVGKDEDDGGDPDMTDDEGVYDIESIDINVVEIS